MTDTNDGPPLTRRERRERERAAEAAAAAAGAPASAELAPDEPEAATAPEVDERLAPTQAADLSALFGEPEPTEAADDAPAGQPGPPRGIGRFFGRKAPEADAEVIEAEIVETDAVDTLAVDDAAPDADAPIEVSNDQTMSVPAPSRADGGSVPLDDIQQLDSVNDAEVDSVEIDEVPVEQRRVSAHRIAEATPAELDDSHRPVTESDDAPSGPSRGTRGRLPVVVNVVQDTSEHHISDLRDDSGAQPENGPVQTSVGTGTSSITANALVLPSTEVSDQIAIEGTDDVIVTGSIDLPEGFASSGRARGTIDSADLDAADDGGEVRSPETAPVRASKAVSSYANARVRIAPQRSRGNVWPVALGVGGGVVVVGVGVVTVMALAFGWI